MALSGRTEDRLKTRQLRPATRRSSEDRRNSLVQPCAHVPHVKPRASTCARHCWQSFKEDELPRNAFYGDGSPIESSALEEIREVYRQASIVFPWQKGDILMLDNFLASHGRRPFVGPRRILVAWPNSLLILLTVESRPLKVRNHCWIGSVQGAVATWSNHQIQILANIACRHRPGRYRSLY